MHRERYLSVCIQYDSSYIVTEPYKNIAHSPASFYRNSNIQYSSFKKRSECKLEYVFELSAIFEARILYLDNIRASVSPGYATNQPQFPEFIEYLCSDARGHLVVSISMGHMHGPRTEGSCWG